MAKYDMPQAQACLKEKMALYQDIIHDMGPEKPWPGPGDADSKEKILNNNYLFQHLTSVDDPNAQTTVISPKAFEGFDVMSKLYAYTVVKTPPENIISVRLQIDDPNQPILTQEPDVTALNTVANLFLTDYVTHQSNHAQRMESEKHFYPGNLTMQGDVLCRTAIALALLNPATEIQNLATAEDVDERRLEQIAAMATLRNFIGTAAKTINSVVGGRAHPEKSFLDDDGLEDTGMARACYAHARNIFTKYCAQLNLDPAQVKSRFDYLTEPKSLTIYDAAYKITRSGFEKETLLEQNRTFLDCYRTYCDVMGSRYVIPEDMPYATVEKLHRISYANQDLVAGNATRENINFVLDDMPESYNDDLYRMISMGIVKERDIAKEPPVEPKKPNAWVRLWNKVGFYKDTMAAYKNDLEAYHETLRQNEELDQFMKDATARLESATLEAKCNLTSAEKAVADYANLEAAMAVDLDAIQMPLESLTKQTYGEKEDHHAAPAKEEEIAAQKSLEKDAPGLHR